MLQASKNKQDSYNWIQHIYNLLDALYQNLTCINIVGSNMLNATCSQLAFSAMWLNVRVIKRPFD